MFHSRKYLETKLAHAKQSAHVFRKAAEHASMQASVHKAEAQMCRRDRDRLAGVHSQILAVLGEVAVYEGLDVSANTVQYISELARDHEELEARIDAALMLISGIHGYDPLPAGGAIPVFQRIADLLRGAERFE